MDETLPPQKPIWDLATRSGSGRGSSGSEVGEESAPERIGPYEVVAELGSGSMGIVYRCSDPDLEREVAVKVLRRRFAGDVHYHRRFRREARAAASVSDPCVVQIHGIHEGSEEPDDPTYIVMELVRGASADDLAAEAGPLEFERALGWIRDAASGLREAARRGLIHRDVKPSNILVSPDDRAKIVDFGLAKELGADSSLTQEGLVLGTPHYISPEQGRGRKVDHRSDIYSLGATFYHLLTGSPPFDGDSHVSVIVAHVNEPPPPLRKARADLQEAAERVIDRMLAKAPDDRYPDYDQLIEDLDALRAGETPRWAGEPTAGDRRRQREGRRRTWIGIAAAFLLVATGLGVVFALPRGSGEIGSLREALGPWYESLPDGDTRLAFDLAALPTGVSAPVLLATIVSLPPESYGEGAVTLETGALRWNHRLRVPLAFPFAFEELQRAEFDVIQDDGRFDLAVAIVDPDHPASRRLLVRLSPRETRRAAPIVAERGGVEVPLTELDVGSDDRPRGGLIGATGNAIPSSVVSIPPVGLGRFVVTVQLTRVGDSTQILARVRKPAVAGASPAREHRIRAVVPGTDWGCGVPSLETASAEPYALHLERVLLEGTAAAPFARKEIRWPR